jgi:hypothetical protein
MTPQNVSVTVPVSQAIDRVKRILFQPFDLGKWFVIGFCAWLACLGQQRFGTGTGFHGGSRDSANVRQSFEQAKEYLMNNLYWVLPLVAVVVVLGLGLWVVMVWLSSRGQFMFLHCVALDRAEVAVPWSKYAREANSLFGFRLVLGLAALALVLPTVLAAILTGLRMVWRESVSVSGIIGLVAAGLGVMTLSIVFGVIAKLTTDFVVPIMFLRGGRCLAAWRTLSNLLAANIGHFVLYLLFQILLTITIFVLVVAVVLVTCCSAGCLMAIPYLGTVLLLPVLIFKRAYSLCYLAQYGPGYDALESPLGVQS